MCENVPNWSPAHYWQKKKTIIFVSFLGQAKCLVQTKMVVQMDTVDPEIFARLYFR